MSSPTERSGHQPPALRAADPSLKVDPYAFTKRIEEDSWRQAERHVTAAGFWGNFQWVAGGLAAVLAAAASGSAFSNNATAAGLLALGATASAALVTALRPGDISSQHLRAAASYNALQATARDLWQFGLDEAPSEQERLRALTVTWVEVTSASPRVPRRLLKKSKKLTDESLNYYPSP